MTKQISPVDNSASKGKKKVEFQIHSKPGSKVFLAGTFTQWTVAPKELKDSDNCGNYTCTVMLAPGVYEYKFIVNNIWIPDPHNHQFNINNLGTLNSVMVVD